MSAGFFLGVDGGATKTLAVIVDADGQETARATAGSGNQAAVGLDRAVANITEAVAHAARQTGHAREFRAAWLGLAGVDCPADHDRILPRLVRLADTVHITNDGELALTALALDIGVAVIAGTGSIALGRDRTGTAARAGGWGHIIGDEGSGYEIGRRALQAAARAADGRGPQTALLAGIMQAWGLHHPDEMLGRVYPEGEKGPIAALSTLVLAAARDGDATARAIRCDAADELARAAGAVGAALTFPQGVPLALAGGLLVHEMDFRAMVVRRIRRRATVSQVAIVAEPALSAARAARYLTQGSS